MVEDDLGDQVSVRMLTPLPLVPDDPPALLMAFGHLLPLHTPYSHDDDTHTVATTRNSERSRGLLFADSEEGLVCPLPACSLLEVKVVETRLRHPQPLRPELPTVTQLLVQLDEELTVETAGLLWNQGTPPCTRMPATFEFEDRDMVIGAQAAEAAGWQVDQGAWASLLELAAERRGRGLRTALLLLSDGSVVGDDFSASSSYGWVSYAAALTDSSRPLSERRYVEADGGYLLAGGGRVAPPPEWTSSTRAEATGLLAALMGAVSAGWLDDIELRLDNDSAVGRGGGLLMEDITDYGFDAAESSAGATLRDAMKTENSDIWTEFVAWRDRHTSTGSDVSVVWHPGHPERRKCPYGSDWNLEDHAIFLADVIADAMHALPTPPRTPTVWSHRPSWRLFWRGTEQHGCIAQRLSDAVRTDLLAGYIQSTGLGSGADTDWVIPELVARTIGRKEGTLQAKVHRAKVTAGILGTKHTQHRRAALGRDDDTLCRLCGLTLETNEHVLWMCPHPAVAHPRRLLSSAVRRVWAATGLGQAQLAVARLLWTLKPDDTVLCTTVADVQGLLGPDQGPEAALLTASLLGHTLDTTGMSAERAGIFGKGWIALLRKLGLGREQALNALADVALLTQGPNGTLAVWQAFTTALDTPEDLISGSVLATSASPCGFDEWLGEVRDKLTAMHVTDDAPYRQLTMMTARGITKEDKWKFFILVQGWRDQVSLPEMLPDRFDWASSLAEAIDNARRSIIDDRRRLGLKQIGARDLARADAKVKASTRRVRPRHAGAPTPARRPLLPGKGPTKRVPKPKGRLPKGLPKRKAKPRVANSGATPAEAAPPPALAPPEPVPAAQPAPTAHPLPAAAQPVPPAQPLPAAALPALNSAGAHSQSPQASRPHKRSRGPAPPVGPTEKRRNASKKRDLQEGCPPLPMDKRLRQDRPKRSLGSKPDTNRYTRAKTREQAAQGTSEQEPD